MSIDQWVLQGSTYAAQIDEVILIIGALVGFWWAVTTAMFCYLLWRWRYQEGVRALYVTGHEHDLHRWVAWPHYAIILCDIVIIVYAVQAWYNVKQWIPDGNDDPATAEIDESDIERIRIVAQQWAWSFQHAGKDGELGTEDDIFTVDELHVQNGRTYIFNLESRDVLHSFSVPVWRIKQDIIPGRVITGWVTPTIAGEFDLQCAEMCGIGHGIMAAKTYVHTPEENQAWIASQTAVAKR